MVSWVPSQQTLAGSLHPVLGAVSTTVHSPGLGNEHRWGKVHEGPILIGVRRKKGFPSGDFQKIANNGLINAGFQDVLRSAGWGS